MVLIFLVFEMCHECKIGWDVTVNCERCGYRFDIAASLVDHVDGNRCSACREEGMSALEDYPKLEYWGIAREKKPL